MRRYLLGQSWFGDGRIDFRGKGVDLLPAWVLTMPLTLLTLGLYWPWWSARKARYDWAHVTLGGARFRCTATGWGLLKLWAGNALLFIGTLGLGLSWVMVREARFWTRHVELRGEPGLEKIRQMALPASATGEGFADFFGLDMGF